VHVHKATTRDLGWLLAEGLTGATTVAATMFLAHTAGIRVFATGGIGGVHRGAEQTFDISADLGQLAATPVAVVSAGIKSILDIGLTLEHLETLGVPTVVVDHDWYPSFYSRSSAFPAPRRVADAQAVANLMHAHWDVLGCTTGISIANPISPTAEIPADDIDSVIDDALRAADRDGITGQAVTPYLLAAVVERTGGRSLRANINLVRANAAFAAQVAVHDMERRS
ncbi:MAG TPA: pseudouridine-5'-phosphate glycosidase, partial [Ilumatobacteraceae bacterium]|nr:pseudouridine-5'-phosphate glycosidase [Ilumatobacteraceae bacterium]